MFLGNFEGNKKRKKENMYIYFCFANCTCYYTKDNQEKNYRKIAYVFLYCLVYIPIYFQIYIIQKKNYYIMMAFNRADNYLLLFNMCPESLLCSTQCSFCSLQQQQQQQYQSYYQQLQYIWIEMQYENTGLFVKEYISFLQTPHLKRVYWL